MTTVLSAVENVRAGVVSGVDSSSNYIPKNEYLIITSVKYDKNGIVTELKICQNSKGRTYKLV